MYESNNEKANAVTNTWERVTDRGVARQWLVKIVPMMWGPGPSRQSNVTAVNVSTKRVDGGTLLGVISRVINCDCEEMMWNGQC